MSKTQVKIAEVKNKPIIDNGNRVKDGNEKRVPRGFRHTETITKHWFPELLPFGDTNLTMRGNRWEIKCGRYRMAGYDGDVDSIVKLFVEQVNQELITIKWETEREEFKTTDNREVNEVSL